MKQFFLWAGLVLALYAGLGAGAYFTEEAAAKKILIAIDVSASLEDVKYKLPDTLAFLSGIRHAQYKIVTNSSNNQLRVLQDWSPRLDLEEVTQKVIKIKMYATLDLHKLVEFDEIKSADQIVFVTNATDTQVLKNTPRSSIVEVR
jgi:hypothetical protein